MALVINTGNATFKTDIAGLLETVQAQRDTWIAFAREAVLAARLLALEEARRLEAEAQGEDPDGGQSPKDLRAARLRAAAEATVQRVAALDVEREIAAIRTPPVARADTLLQGRITDESQLAAGPVTVTLIDEKGTPVAGVAAAKVDASGYYAFVLKADQAASIGTKPLTLLIGSDAGQLVPAAAKPFTLANGKTVIAETRLQVAELEKLKLRAPLKDGGRLIRDVAPPVAAPKASVKAAPKAAKTAKAAPKPAAKKTPKPGR